MLAHLAILLVFTLSVNTQEQATPNSPCPNVFEYETPGSEPGRWYGVVHLSTDSTLYSLWLNIVLDGKADILGNWIGDVTTEDNMNFKIESSKTTINPGPAMSVRFFVQYNTLNKAPRLINIRLNGREICNIPQPAVERPLNSNPKPNRVTTTTERLPTRRTQRPIGRPTNTDSRTQAPEKKPVTTERTQTPIRRPQDTEVRPQVPDTRTQSPDTRPEQGLQTRPVQSWPSNEAVRPVYVKPVESANPSNIATGDISSQSYDVDHDRRPTNDNRYTTAPSVYRPPQTQQDLSSGSGSNSGNSNSQYDTNRRPVNSDNRFTPSPPVYRPPTQAESNHHGSSEDGDNDYFTGGPILIVPSLNSPYNNSDQNTCGRVQIQNPTPLVLNGTPTIEGQWPWQIALYQTQTVDNKYICGGTLVSHLHVITAAHCVAKKNSRRVVNKDTLTVYLGKHNLRTSVKGVQIRFVEEIILHPEYNAETFSRDVSILRLRERVTYSRWIQPACLWPSNQVPLDYVIGKKGAVVGWGFDETGMATEELSLVEMPVVDTETCIRSYSEFFVRFTSQYTYCAGYRDGRTSVCNGDSGGGMVFKLGDSWYLRGLVSLSVARDSICNPSHYIIFSDLAKFLPWIQEHIYDY